MQTIIIFAVSVLGCIFIASFVALIILCRQMYYTKKWNVEHYEPVDRTRLVLNDDEDAELEIGEVDLFNCDQKTMQKLLETEAFAFDAQGVMPQCITILKLCRHVTEKLVGLTMSMNPQNIYPDDLAEIIQIAQKISPRVDEVMRALQPPLNAHRLETNCGSLIMSVSHLAFVVKRGCKMYPGSWQWIEDSVTTLDAHMRVLKQLTSKTDRDKQPRYRSLTSDNNCPIIEEFEDQSCDL